jgi:hypothetical protein
MESDYGITGTGIRDRVADVGNLIFYLRNDSGKYLPGSTSAWSGFVRGIPIRLSMSYLGVTYIKFYGHINDIEPDTINRKVKVTAYDWMDLAANFSVGTNFKTQVNIKSHQIINLIITTKMWNPPQMHTYTSGSYMFVSAMDNFSDSSRALGEFQKVAISEMCYIYLRRDPTYGENLVVESKATRNSTNTVKTFNGFGGDSLLTESGSPLLTESGDYLGIEYYTANFTNMLDDSITYGDYIVNQITTKSYPRVIDSASVVLCQLDQPFYIAPGETVRVFSSYRNPNIQSSKISGTGQATPIPGLDVLMNSSSDGSGSDMTYYMGEVYNHTATKTEFVLTNTSASGGWITKMQTRGHGIYTYNDVSYTAMDITSQTNYGYNDETLDMKYHVTTQSDIADTLLSQYKNPATRIESIHFVANYSDFLLSAFLNLDIGDLINVRDDLNSLASTNYYIHRIVFTVHQGNTLEYTYWLVPFLTLT